MCRAVLVLTTVTQTRWLPIVQPQQQLRAMMGNLIVVVNSSPWQNVDELLRLQQEKQKINYVLESR